MKIVAHRIPEITFEVVYNIALFNSDIAASIQPISNTDVEQYGQAFADWEDFVSGVIQLMSEYEFEVIDYETSNKSRISHYFSFYIRDAEGNVQTRVLIFLRLSTHDLRDLSADNKYHEKRAQELKWPKTKKRQVWKSLNVIVNDKTYDDYDDALDALDEKFKQLVRKYS